MSNVVIVGLDHIGASLGLSLQRAVPEWSIWGADIDRGRRQQAKKAGVVGDLARNLRHAVDIADSIIINTNLTIRETIFQNQGKDIKEDAVVIDLTSLKQRGLELARQYIPETSYIGAHIVVKSHTVTGDIDEADHALFTNSLFCIVTSKDTDGRSLKCAESLARYIDANPLFFSTEEFDGL
jgi:prephenate dehydrogenase